MIYKKRGDGRTPETYYNSGTLNSITLWLPEYNVPITDYLSAADMQWFESDTFEEKMEKIHLQKYYALFLVFLVKPICESI